VLIATLAALTSYAPDIAVRTEDAALADLHRRLTVGRLDAVLTNLTPPATPETNRVELARDTMCLAFRSDRAPRAASPPEVLHRAPLIVRTHCELLQAASRILDERQVRPVVVSRTDSDTRALELVAAGAGACLLPDSFTAPGITMVELATVRLTRSIGLRWTDATRYAQPLHAVFPAARRPGKPE
jgi:LysR family hydrogen peroxide-inducible transcriptional activator